MKRVAAFIDRDGVINEDKGYVNDRDDFVLLPGALEGLARLQAAGYLLIVVTNQSGIGRGMYSETEYQIVTRFMRNLLKSAGIMLSGVYHCPHHPQHGLGKYLIRCQCRKPNPGLLMQARDDLDLDLSRSVLIGDRGSDIGACRAAGLRSCILVQSGQAVTDLDIRRSDYSCMDLGVAARWVVERFAEST